jgi:hypothetical protein
VKQGAYVAAVDVLTQRMGIIRRALLIPPRPNPVTGIVVTGFTSSSVSLSWTANDPFNLAAYRIYYSTDNVTFAAIAAYIGSPPPNDQGLASGLNANTLYYFKVSAKSSSGLESALQQTSVAQFTGPDPAGVAAAVALYDGSGGLIGYGPSVNTQGLFYGVAGLVCTALIGVPGGTLAEGGPADITILAPDVPVTVHAAAMKSKSKNMPFEGWTLKGSVAATIVGGRVVFVNAATGFSA